MAFQDEDIARLRIALARIARVLAKQSADEGLTHTQLSVLASVVRDGPVGLSELAEFEGVNPTMLSRIVGKLDERGLITRVVDPDDRRAARVEATPAGRQLQRDSRARRTRLLEQQLTDMPAGRVDELLAALPALELLADQLGPRRAGTNCAPNGSDSRG
ncbi:MAG TPA: MarR family transcriptional regulator [Pseudonocardia sp.]|jgi:DNA-binding MarR family transcriptional regulator